MAKLGEKHTFECDVCGEVETSNSSDMPPSWCEAVLQLNRGYTSSRYLVCAKHDGGQYTWKERRRGVFRTLFAKCNPFATRATESEGEK